MPVSFGSSSRPIKIFNKSRQKRVAPLPLIYDVSKQITKDLYYCQACGHKINIANQLRYERMKRTSVMPSYDSCLYALQRNKYKEHTDSKYSNLNPYGQETIDLDPKECWVEDNFNTQTEKPAIRELYKDNRQDVKNNPKLDWNDYYRLGSIYDFMNELESKYPSICSTLTFGKSTEGRDLKILKISNSVAGNASVWIDAGIHGREWIAPATATFICNHIVRNFDNLPEWMNNKDWYIVPVLNPDGYEYSHKTDRMWRKNRATYKGMRVGVDLNRNFSLGWGGKGSSSNHENNFYRGPTAFSEPESTALKDMILNNGITFKVYLTLHSYGQVILFPFAFQDKPCRDYTRLLEGATVMSKAIYKSNGNTYKVGLSRDVMFGASGTSNDWSYGVAGIPYCYLIELRSKQHRFQLPKEEIVHTGKEIVECITALMEFVDNYERT